MKLHLPKKLTAALLAACAALALNTTAAAATGTQTFTGGDISLNRGDSIFDSLYVTKTMTTGTASANHEMSDLMSAVNITQPGDFRAVNCTISVWVTRESLQNDCLIFSYGGTIATSDTYGANGFFWHADTQTLQLGRGKIVDNYSNMAWKENSTSGSLATAIGETGDMVNFTFAVASASQAETPTIWVNGKSVGTLATYAGNMNGTANPMNLYAGTGVTYGNVSITTSTLTNQSDIYALMGVSTEKPAVAFNYVWKGDKSAVWDTTTENWVTKEDGATSVAFKSGDENTVTLNADGQQKEISLETEASISKLTVEDSYKLTIAQGASLTTGTLAVSGALAIDGTGTVTAGSIAAEGKTISLDEGVVLKGVSSGKGTLDGSGKYELNSGVDSMGGVTLATTWTGTVKLSNITTQQLDLNNYGTAKSVVEIDGWSKFLKNSNGYVYNPKLRLTGSGMTIQDGYSNYSYEFAGGVEGAGDFKIGITTNANNQTYAFTGDLSHWTGAYESQKSKNTTIKFYGSATEIGAAIKQTAGTINIEVGNGTTAFSTVFDQAVTATTLDIKDKATATFKNDATIGSITSTGTLKVDADTHTVTLNGGTLDNTIAVQAGTLQLNGTFDITGNIGEMTATYSDGDNGFKTTQGTITVYTKSEGAEVNIVDGTQFIYDTAPVELTIDGTYEAPAHTDNTTYYVNKGTANFTSALAQEDMEHIVMSNDTELNVDADGTLTTLTADGSVQLTNEGWERRSLTLGSVEGGSDVKVTGAIDVTIAGTITGTRDLTAMRLCNGATVHVTMGTGNAEILNLGSSDGSGTVVLEGGNLSYRSNLDYNTLRLEEGSTLLFGQAGDDTTHTYAGNIEVEGDANVKTFGTSQHPSATISGNVRGGGTLTRVNDGNQTLTFTSAVELYGYTNNDEQGGNLTDFQGSTHIEELKIGNGSNTKFSNEDTTIGSTEVNGSGSIEFAHDYILKDVSSTGNHALTLKAAEGATVTLDDIALYDLVAGGAGNLLVAEGTTLALGHNLTPIHGTVEVSGTLNVGHEVDLSKGNTSTGKLHIYNGGSVTAADGMWMTTTALGVLLEEGGTYAITGKGVSFTGKEGSGSITAHNEEVNYSTENANAIINNVVMTATKDITIGNTLSDVDVVTGDHAVTLNTNAASVTVSDGGTFTLGDGATVENIAVVGSGTVAGNVEIDEVTIAAGADATFNDQSFIGSVDEGVYLYSINTPIVIHNGGVEAAKYTDLHQQDMEVFAETLSSAAVDVTVENTVAVGAIQHQGAGSLTLAHVNAELLDAVEVTNGSLILQDVEASILSSMEIASGSTVAVYTEGAGSPEGTVTITESLTAGGGTLLADLTLLGHEGDELLTWNLNGQQMTLGSTLTLDTASGLIQLDDATMQEIAGLTLGGYWELVVDGGTGLQYDGNEWYDGVFSRTYTNDEGVQTQLGGDYKVQLLDGGNSFGIVKVSNVPEPTTGTLSLLALMALAARRRRK